MNIPNWQPSNLLDTLEAQNRGYAKKIEELLKAAEQWRVHGVKTEGDIKDVTVLVAQIATIEKRCEERRKEAKAPHVEASKIVDAFFGNLVLGLASAKEGLSTLIGEGMAQFGEAHARSDYGQTAYKRQRWDFEIVDIALVPREYFSLDERLVRQAIRSGIRDIPGLRVYDAGKIVVRT